MALPLILINLFSFAYNEIWKFSNFHQDTQRVTAAWSEAFKHLIKPYKTNNITCGTRKISYNAEVFNVLHAATSQYLNNSDRQAPCQNEDKIYSMHPFDTPQNLTKCKHYSKINISPQFVERRCYKGIFVCKGQTSDWSARMYTE
jgi:hypothetical protein